MAELDDDATEGQLADYLAAEASGDYGAWNMGIVEYQCPQCSTITQLVADDLRDFLTLITAWHQKANDGDYFSRFVFEYLAFIAHVKNNLFYTESSDRLAIQRFKQDEVIKDRYLQLINDNPELQSSWVRVIEELDIKPLRNSSSDLDNPEIDKWWNTSTFQPNPDHTIPRGKVLRLDDWQNMVEFWCAIRNNLFHGGKNPNIHRDLFLVEQAYLTLSPLMASEIEKFQQS